MNKADVVKAEVIVSNGKTFLLGTVKYVNDQLNFKVPFNWNEVYMDEEGFLEALRDKFAEDLDIIPSKVDLKQTHLLRKMREGTFEAVLKGYI